MFYVCSNFHRIICFCLKKQISQIPGIGWWCTRLKFPCLNRSSNDINILAKMSSSFPNVIYPEGTRYTKKNYASSCEYAKQNGYQISKYAQLPKHKGSFALMKNYNTVYHMTIIYLDQHQNIMKGEIRTFPSRIYIHVKKYIDAPQDELEYKKWIQQLFMNIDDYYDNFSPINVTEMKSKMFVIDYILHTSFYLLQLYFGYFLIQKYIL